MFRRSTPGETEPGNREKITVVLLQRHVAYLDVLGVLIRVRHQKVVPRADIIHALVEFADRSEIDLSRFASTDEMVGFLTDYFGQLPHQARLCLLLEQCLFPSMRPPVNADQVEIVANA